VVRKGSHPRYKEVETKPQQIHARVQERKQELLEEHGRCRAEGAYMQRESANSGDVANRGNRQSEARAP